jgi:hypothetical protein
VLKDTLPVRPSGNYRDTLLLNLRLNLVIENQLLQLLVDKVKFIWMAFVSTCAVVVVGFEYNDLFQFYRFPYWNQIIPTISLLHQRLKRPLFQLIDVGWVDGLL